MGYTQVEVNDVPQTLYGYRNDARKEKANVIVRRAHISSAANDLGFVKAEDGTYSAIVSAFDSGKHNATWMTALKVAYTEKVDLKTAKKNGLQFLGKSIVNGKVQLKFIDTRR
jgi:hypothetical protein